MLATYVGLWKSATIMGRRYLLTHLTASYIVACCCFLQTWDVRICCFNEPTYLNTLKRVVAQWYSQRISVLEVAGSVPASVIVELLWLKILCEFIHQTWFRNNWMSDCRPPGNNRQTAWKSEVIGLSTINIRYHQSKNSTKSAKLNFHQNFFL